MHINEIEMSNAKFGMNKIIKSNDENLSKI